MYLCICAYPIPQLNLNYDSNIAIGRFLPL